MIPLFKVASNTELAIQYITSVLESGYITQGDTVREFETRLKEKFKYPHILTLNSATSGLTLALRLLDLKDGDEVLSTPLTCVATNMAIMANRLKIKWVDVDLSTCNMDLSDLEKKITDKTKAIMVVHWGGNPIDINKLNEIRDKHNIPVIEDCAHAFGSKFNDSYLGTHGNIAVYSLQAIKPLTCADGGLILLPNERLFKRARLLRWYGIDRESNSSIDSRIEDDIKEWGYKFHMNDFNAALGMANLNVVFQNVFCNQENASFYNEQLRDLKNIKIINSFPDCSYWIYTIKILPHNKRFLKNKFISFMKEKKIQVSSTHRRNDTHSCFSQFESKLPNLDILDNEMICIPVGWWLSASDLEYIVSCIKHFDKHINKYIYCIETLNLNDIEKYIELISKLHKIKINLDKNSLIEKYTNILKQDGTIYVVKIKSNEDDDRFPIIATGKIFIEYKFCNNVAHIEDIIVDDDYRHLGIGTMLIKHLIDQVKKLDTKDSCYKIILNCKESNSDFYSNLKFENDGLLFTCRL